MKAYEFKAYVQNNQMTIPKDFGEILNNKSVRVIVLEKEDTENDTNIAPEHNIINKKSTNKKNPPRKIRKREEDSDNQLKSMLDEYGMGSAVLGDESEREVVIQRLYKESRALLESMQGVMQKVEKVLYERESITKSEVRKYIDEIL